MGSIQESTGGSNFIFGGLQISQRLSFASIDPLPSPVIILDLTLMSDTTTSPNLNSEAPEATGTRVLLTGATGFLGGRVLRDLAGNHQVFATHHGALEETASYITPVRWEASKGAPEVLLALFEPDVVVHLMALTRTEACAKNPEKARLLNTEVTARLGQAACYRGVRMVFASTDLVFDGAKGNYTEKDEPRPTSTYAQTKREAEQALQQIFRDHPELLTIFRVGLSYGWGDSAHTGPIGWLFHNAESGQPTDLFTDEFRTPLFQGDASRAILEAIEHQHAGLFHLGGPDRVDRYTLGMRIAERFGLDTRLIRKKSIRDYQGPEPRAADCSMVSAKFIETFGWAPVGIEEGLERMREERKGL